LVLSMEDALSQLHSMWVEGIKNASKDVNTSVSADTSLASEETTKNTATEDGVRYSVKHPVFTEKDIENNLIALSSMNSVYNVHESKLKKSGLKPGQIFENFFNSLNNNIYSEVFGDISLKKSSVKSEIRHGVTAEKIASIEAIPSVIEKGKVVFFKNKPESDVYRIVVAAPIKIGSQSYYMGVMLQRDTQNQRLYLHNVVIEKETSLNSQADLLTTGALENNEHLFITTILQKAIDVKKNAKNSDIKKLQRDTTYLEAVNNGDMETAQRMVDEAAKEAGYTVKAYHGTKFFGFTKFDLSKSNYNRTIYLTNSDNIASTYSGVSGARALSDSFTDALDDLTEKQIVAELNKVEYSTDDSPYIKYYLTEQDMIVKSLFGGMVTNIINKEQAKADLIEKRSKGNYALYTNLGNSFVLDCKGAEAIELTGWNKDDLSQIGTTNDVADYAKSNGYDSVTFKNILDNGGMNDKVKAGTLTTVYAVFDSANVKSADPVTYDDNGDVIPLSERFNEENEDIRYSSRDTLDDIEQSFGISKVNDYVHVQKQVIQTLTNEGFFDKNIVKVIENNMVVEITKDGIKETLGPGKRYQSLPRLFKKLKLTTLRDLPIIIANSKILEDNVSDIHNDNSNLKYTYLENKVLVDDVEYNVTIAIRKSPQKNKFWVHEVRINKKEQSLSSSSENLKQESMEFSVRKNSVSQSSEDVKYSERTGDNQETERNLSTDSQVGEKLYQSRPTLDDFIFDDTDGEITDTDAFLVSQYITGDVRTISHIVNNTKNIDISDAKINQVVSRLVKSYDLSDSYNKDI